MKTFAAVLAVIGICSTLAGCIEVDLSRTNGNQKDDAVETTDTVE
jgi:hypothetical protein